MKLACVQPGETVATFGDALRRLTDRATYLYVDGQRYWYSTQPSVTRTAEDRASQLSEHDVNDEIHKRLREEARSRGEFSRVYACVPSADIPDEQEARLVILGPEYAHTSKDPNSAARAEAASILDNRGSSPRNYKNSLVFLAADATRLKELQQAVRHYLAWTSIWNDREALNLDAFQSKQAEAKLKSADETVDSRIPEAFQWLLSPGQPDPKGGIEWTENRLQGQDSLAVKGTRKLKNEEQLFVQMGGGRLRLELDRIPLWRGNHVGLKQVAEDMARYLYLPRLKDEAVLLGAIHDGVSKLTWETETFAYADSWDEVRNRYLGLAAGKQVNIVADSRSLVVKPDVAAQQFAAMAAASPTPPGSTYAPATGTAAGKAVANGTLTASESTKAEAKPSLPRRFHGSVDLDPTRLGRDAGKIAEEVVQHLTTLIGSDVRITLEIQAEIPDGIPEKTVRTVTENCRTLKFKTQGFEEK